MVHSNGMSDENIFVCLLIGYKDNYSCAFYNGNIPFQFQTWHIQIFLFNFAKGIILTLGDFSSKKIMIFFSYLAGIHKLSAEK